MPPTLHDLARCYDAALADQAATQEALNRARAARRPAAEIAFLDARNDAALTLRRAAHEAWATAYAAQIGLVA